MARWSGAKARCGYYANSRSCGNFTLSYNPDKPNERFHITNFDISIIAICILFMPITIVVLIVLLPFAFIVFLINIYEIYGRIINLKKMIKITNGSIVFDYRNKRIIFASNPDFSTINTIDKASEMIAKLNKLKYCGHTNWRIPTFDEMWTLHNMIYSTCKTIYTKTGRNYPIRDMFNKIGIIGPGQTVYMCQGRSEIDSDGFCNIYHIDMIWGLETLVTSERVVNLWPVCDPS